MKKLLLFIGVCFISTMARATVAKDAQVQNYVDTYIRPSCDNIRSMKIQLDADIAAINDVYANVTQSNVTWLDQAVSTQTSRFTPLNPPHLLTASDILAINEFWHTIQTDIANESNYGILLEACPDAAK